MKTIEVSDEIYDTLMELSKELQTQDGNGQAFPMFWTPSSIKKVPCYEGQGETYVYESECKASYSLEEILTEEYKDSTYREEFVKDNRYEEDGKATLEAIKEPYTMYKLQKWIEEQDDHYIVEEREERVCEHNVSFFSSDVVNFCNTNQHHLGKDPQSYSHTAWRMPKMEKLIEIIARLNPQSQEDSKNDVKYRIEKEFKTL